MPKDKSAADVKAELETTLASELAARKFSYTRTDGSQWTLALKDVLDRTLGAGDGLQPQRLRRAQMGRGGGERRSLDLQAACACGTADQDGIEYRAWFHERRRPPRG